MWDAAQCAFGSQSTQSYTKQLVSKSLIWVHLNMCPEDLKQADQSNAGRGASRCHRVQFVHKGRERLANWACTYYPTQIETVACKFTFWHVYYAQTRARIANNLGILEMEPLHKYLRFAHKPYYLFGIGTISRNTLGFEAFKLGLLFNSSVRPFRPKRSYD